MTERQKTGLLLLATPAIISTGFTIYNQVKPLEEGEIRRPLGNAIENAVVETGFFYLLAAMPWAKQPFGDGTVSTREVATRTVGTTGVYGGAYLLLTDGK